MYFLAIVGGIVLFAAAVFAVLVISGVIEFEFIDMDGKDDVH